MNLASRCACCCDVDLDEAEVKIFSVFRIFEKLQKQTSAMRLLGLNLTDSQQMWLTMTLYWCGGKLFSEESQLYRISTERWKYAVHPSPAFRILGPFSNSEQFSEDWNCPKGSKMNRDTKCTLFRKDL